MPLPAEGRRLLFFIPEDWYVCSHRLPLITGARREGWDVTVVTRVGDAAGPIRAAGAAVVATGLRRGFRNPLADLAGWFGLVRTYRRLRPDVVHHVTPKSCLYGSAAALVAGVPRVVNAMAGLGFLYTSDGLKARLARPLVTAAFRAMLGRGRTRLIVQNEDDRAFFAGTIGVPEAKIVLIRGSGVDTAAFRPAEPPTDGPIRAVLVARMIREKGLFELVEAARLLRGRGVPLELVFAGETDTENPSGVPADQLRAWQDEGLITWLGRVADVPALLRTCHLAVLPSYREGFPKSLLEAAAAGLPVVATDTVGCREICLPGINGVRVPVGEAAPLADALAELAADPARRAAYGAASRRLVEEHFAEEIIVDQTMATYRELLADDA